MFIRSISATLVLASSFCAVQDPRVDVRAASVDGSVTRYEVELDHQTRFVRRERVQEAIVVTVADASHDRLVAALERDGEVRYFDATLAPIDELGDEGLSELVDLSLAGELTTDAPPIIESRRMMRDCEKEPELHPCDGDPWYLCGSR